MTDTPDIASLRARLAELAGLGERQQADDRAIREAAERRLDAINAEVDQLRPQINVDDGAAGKYSALTLERGELQRTLALLGIAE